MKVHEASQVVSGCGSSGRLTAAGALAAVVAAGCGAGDLSAPSEVNEAAVAHLRPDTLRYMGTSEGVSAFLARGADGDECFVMAYDARSSQVTCGEVASSREPVILIGGNVPSDTVWGSALLPDGYSQATADGKALPVTGRVAFLRLTPIPKSIVIDASGEGKPTIKIPIDMRASSD